MAPSTRAVVIASVLATLVVCAMALTLTRRSEYGKEQPAYSRSEIDSLLIKLQSPDQSDVNEAEEKLIALGASATAPLLSLLNQLTIRSERHQDKPFAYEPLRVPVNYATKSRSLNVIYSILSRLHAVGAVPLLIAIMEEEEIDNMIQGMSPVMRTLAAIGSAAVPQLINSIGGARDSALSLPELSAPSLTEATRERRLGWLQGRIELRATLVLREIGDQQAIPALERLMQRSNNEFIVNQASEAIGHIKNIK